MPINEKSLRSLLGCHATTGCKAANADVGRNIDREQGRHRATCQRYESQSGECTSQALMHCGKAVHEGVVAFSDSALYGEIFQTQCFTTRP